MPILLKNAHVYTPENKGVNDVLIANDRILRIGANLADVLPGTEVIDLKGRIVTPGFFDQHIHVTGGGGEGGPATRTPELFLSELVLCGTTNVVGVSGTDFTTRSIENLLAKVRALSSEGVNTWMYTSNYRYPATTLSGSVAKDLLLVPEVVGCKIALGDHRSSFPTLENVLSLLAEIRVGGMIAGKLGVLHVHLGNIPGPFAMFDEIVRRGMPIRHIRPTHVNRQKAVFEAAVGFALKGGRIDITSGIQVDDFESPAAAIIEALEAGVDPQLITMSTDGHGSIPRFNDKGEMVGLGVGGVDENLKQVRELIVKHGMPVEKALPFVTKNVAQGLNLAGHGVLKEGVLANLNVFTPDMELTHVISKGRMMMREKELVTVGTFEVLPGQD